MNSRNKPRRSIQFRHVTKTPSPQILCNLHSKIRDDRNPFIIRSYAKCRVSLAFSSNNSHSGTHLFPSSRPGPIYPLSFQLLTGAPTQRQLTNSFTINLLRTLFLTTEGCPLIHPGPEGTGSSGYPSISSICLSSICFSLVSDRGTPVAALDPECYDLVFHDPC